MRPAPARSPARSTGSWRDATSARLLRMLSQMISGRAIRTCPPTSPVGSARPTRPSSRSGTRRPSIRSAAKPRCATGSGLARATHSSQRAVKLLRSLAVPTASQTRLRVFWTMSGQGRCPRLSRPRRSVTLSEPRSRGCWMTANWAASHPAMPMRWTRFSRTASIGSMSPRFIFNPMPRRPILRPCARWSMIWLTPNMKNTARQTWMARPSGARSIERLHGKSADRNRGLAGHAGDRRHGLYDRLGGADLPGSRLRGRDRLCLYRAKLHGDPGPPPGGRATYSPDHWQLRRRRPDAEPRPLGVRSDTLWPDPLADRARDEGQWVLRGARDRVHPRQAGDAGLPRQLHLLEGFPACADRGAHGPRQDHWLCHSEPADLARLRRDARWKGRVFRGHSPAPRRRGRQGLSLCPHRLGGQAHASLQPTPAHL